MEIYWTPAAFWALRSIPWREAARVDAAVLRFADQGEGEISRVHAHDFRALRLHVPPYKVRVYLDPETATLTVGWIFRER